MSWTPILGGALEREAWRAIRDVARAISAGHGEQRHPPDLLLFWSYLGGAIEEDWVLDQQQLALAEVIEGLRSLPHIKGLFGGLAGTGFVLAHVAEPETVAGVLDPIDAIVEDELSVERWRGHYDLIAGLVGRGVYLLERYDTSGSPTARRALARLLDHLLALAETSPDGMAWFTPPELVPAGHRQDWPDGYFNCGLAHGNAGVLALLSRLVGLDPRARTACAELTRWLLAQRLPRDPRGRYSIVVGRDAAPRDRTRAAWCYGDPGVAIALWSVAVRTEQPIADALELASDTAARDVATCGVVDAGLCHGAAGLGHIFNRLYQSGRHPELRAAATRWFERTLAMRRDGEGVGGFAAWKARRPEESATWVPIVEFLGGAIGVALALLAAVHPVEPAWDRLLLCDIVPCTTAAGVT